MWPITNAQSVGIGRRTYPGPEGFRTGAAVRRAPYSHLGWVVNRPHWFQQNRLRKATGVGTPHSASSPPGFPGRDNRSGGPRDSGAAPDLAHGQSERLANHGLLNPPGAEALGANPLALGGRARLNADPLKVRAEDPAGNAGGLPAVSSQVLRLTTLSQLVSARGLLPAHVATHSHRTSLTARLTSSATPARTRMVRTGNPFCNRGPISAETPWGPRGFRLRHSLFVGVAGVREDLCKCLRGNWLRKLRWWASWRALCRFALGKRSRASDDLKLVPKFLTEFRSLGPRGGLAEIAVIADQPPGDQPDQVPFPRDA